MDKEMVKREALIMDKKEKKLMRECFKYCRHRLNKHPHCGLSSVVDIKFVDYVLEVLKDEGI